MRRSLVLRVHAAVLRYGPRYTILFVGQRHPEVVV
jgi:hypothetical protein